MKYILNYFSVLILSLIFTALLPWQSPAYADNNGTCDMGYPGQNEARITCSTNPPAIYADTGYTAIICSGLRNDNPSDTYSLVVNPVSPWISWIWGEGDVIKVAEHPDPSGRVIIQLPNEPAFRSVRTHNYQLKWINGNNWNYCNGTMSYKVNSVNSGNALVPAAPVDPAPANRPNKEQGSGCQSNYECQTPLKCLDNPKYGIQPGGSLQTCQKPSAPAPVAPAVPPAPAAQAPAAVPANDPYAAGYNPPSVPGKLGLDTPCDPNDDNCQSLLKCTYSFDDASKQGKYSCQKQSKPGLSERCDNTDKAPCQGDLQCVWAYTDTTVKPNKNIYTCQNLPKISEGLQCGDLRNNGKCVDGTVCSFYRTDPDTGENIYTCQKPSAGIAPGQGAGGQITTFIKAHIHGTNDTSKIGNGYLNLMKLDKGVVDVGARVYTKDTITSTDPRREYCNIKIKTVDLFFEKIADKNSRAIPPQLIDINLEGNSKPTNCWSFTAKVDEAGAGAGQYRLTAKYPGDNEFAPSEGVAYIIIADKAKGDMYAKGTISTKTTIKIKTSNKNLNDVVLDLSQKTRVALQKGMKVSTTEQAINLLELIGAKAQSKIAGLAVKSEGGRYVLYNDPTSSNDGFEITPATAVAGEECSIDKIPAVNLVVNKILNDGSTVQILNEPNYPNCYPTTITFSRLGDISQVNRVEISAGYPSDAASDYNPSSGDLVIYMSNTPVESKPYVKLSSNPSADKITPYDGSMQIVAATNKVSANPIFEVTHNGVTESKQASSGSDNCSNGNGVCSYYLNIYQPVGQFTITFKNEGVLDTISFNTDDNTGTAVETNITGAGILMGGGEIPLPLDGGQIDLKLDPAGSNAYQVIIHRSNGLPDLRQTITFVYSPPGPADTQPQPAQTPVAPATVRGGTCGECIFSDRNGCHQGYCKDLNNCGFNNGCIWQDGCADVTCP